MDTYVASMVQYLACLLLDLQLVGSNPAEAMNF
jgi:hypothetical protein